MNKNKKIAKTMTAAMAGVMLVQTGSYPVLANEKEETVYVQADARGDVTDIIVSDWLKNENGQSSMEDSTDLKDIKNVKGDETFSRDGDRIVWDAAGNDIYYQGTTDKELPVSLHAEYYLDGQKISPDELAGKSGHVKIRYTYENSSEYGGVYTPFVMVSGFVLPADTFKNVKADNGKVISDGDKDIVIGVGMPGLARSLKLEETEMLKDISIPDSFEVEADVTDFSLSMSMTAAVPLNLDELGIEDIEGWDDLKDSLEDLTDASKELVDGSGELADGVQTLKDSCVDLIDGMNEVDENMGTLADGISTLDGKKGELIDGIHALADGIQTLENKKGTLVKGVSDLAKGSTDLRKGVAEVKKGSRQLADGSKQLQTGAKELASGEGTQKLQSGSKILVSGSQSLALGSRALADGIGTMVEGEEGKSLLAGAGSLEESSKTLSQGLDAYVDGSSAMAAGVMQYVEGVNRYMENADKVITMLSSQAAPSANAEGNAPGTAQESAAAGQPSDVRSAGERGIVTEEVVRTTVSEGAVDEIQTVLNNLKGVQSAVNGAATKEDLIKLYASYDQYVAELNDCISLLDDALGGIRQETFCQVTGEAGTQTTDTETGTLAPVTESAAEPAAAAASSSLFGQGGEIAASAAGNPVGELKKAEAQLKENGQKLTAAATGLTTADANTGMTAGEQLKAGAAALADGAGALNGGIQTVFRIAKEQLKPGADTLAAGLGTLAAGASELDNGLGQLISGAGVIESNLEKFVTATDSLLEGSKTLYAGSKKLEKGAGRLNEGAGTLSGGIGQLSSGSAKLENGADALGSGVSELAEGSLKLKDGTSRLAEGGLDLDEGVSELKDGADELRDGMAEFNEEGIEKLTSCLDEDVQEVIDRLLELQDAGNAYTQFSNSGDMDGNVKFIIETTPIE